MMTFEQAFSEHLAEVESPTVRESIRTWLGLFCAWSTQQELRELGQLSPAIVANFQSELRWQVNRRGRLYSPNTVQAAVVRVRRFLRWALERGLVDTDLARPLKTPHVDTPPEPLLTARELAALLAAPNHRTPDGMRDVLLLELLATTRISFGRCLRLRLDELANLELEPRVSRCLDTYLKRARPQLVGSGDLLFGSRSGPGLSTVRLNQIVAQLARTAGISERVNPRRLRKSYQALLERSATRRLPVQQSAGPIRRQARA